MIQEGLEPSSAVISSLVEAHAPTQLHTAFKLMAATLKMPSDSMPSQPAILMFLQQCEMQEVDQEAIGRVEDVLGGFKSRGYRMNAGIKGAYQVRAGIFRATFDAHASLTGCLNIAHMLWCGFCVKPQALKTMEVRKLQEAKDLAERGKRANDAQHRSMRQRAEQQAEEAANQRALVVAEQQASAESRLQSEIQAEKLHKMEEEKRLKDELARRAHESEALVLAAGHRERKAQLEMIRQSQESVALRVRQEAEMVLWETEQRMAVEYNARRANEEAKHKDAERAAREAAEERANRLEMKLAEAQQTLTAISQEAQEQQAREKFEGTIFFACSNGDLDLGVGTLQQMIDQKIHPTAEALGGVVELHLKPRLETAFKLLQLSLDLPSSSMAPRSVMLGFLRECEQQHVDEKALCKA
jgi:chemotaxis protein histidine kinase CheA